ncbi:unnamed protein product [Rhodiola kirilowii]
MFRFLLAFWLQHTPGFPPVEDGTARFMELLENIRNVAHVLPNSYVNLLIPGPLSNHGPLYFVSTKRFCSKEGLACHIAKIHSEGDIRALENLTYERLREFIMKNKLPESIPLISFHSEASIARGVLATLTQIAHAELPWLPFPSFGNEEVDDSTQAIRKVPVVMPVSAAMVVCALHLQLRYGEKKKKLDLVTFKS